MFETWQECIDEDNARETSPDKAKATSLVKTADGRIEYIKESEIKESNANYIFENYYTSITEYLHALTSLDGFKVTNHICLGCYLKDKLGKADLARIFDDLRYKRNGLVYYGQAMDFDIAKDVIQKSKSVLVELKGLLKGKI